MKIQRVANENWPTIESLLLTFPSSDYREYLAGQGYRLYPTVQVRRLVNGWPFIRT